MGAPLPAADAPKIIDNIRFNAIGDVAPTSITLNFSGNRTTKVDNGGNTVSGQHQDLTVIIYLGVNVQGTMVFQGGSRPKPAGWQRPLTVMLFTPGVDVMNTAPVATYNVMTDFDATNNLATFTLAAVTPGTYDISAVSPGTLVNVKKNVTISVTQNTLDMETLLAGNAVNWNNTVKAKPLGQRSDKVDISDFGKLAICFLKQVTGPTLPAPGTVMTDTDLDGRLPALPSSSTDADATKCWWSDFDGNGTVNISDFGLLATNFLKLSPVDITTPASATAPIPLPTPAPSPTRTSAPSPTPTRLAAGRRRNKG